MGANHPGITVRVYHRAAAITPKHIYHRTLAGGAEFGRFVDDLVHVFYIDEEAGRRSAYALRAPLSIASFSGPSIRVVPRSVSSA